MSKKHYPDNPDVYYEVVELDDGAGGSDTFYIRHERERIPNRAMFVIMAGLPVLCVLLYFLAVIIAN